MSILTTTHKTFIEIEFIEDICIKNAIEKAIEISKINKLPTLFRVNQVCIKCTPDSLSIDVFNNYIKTKEILSANWLNSLECHRAIEIMQNIKDNS